MLLKLSLPPGMTDDDRAGFRESVRRHLLATAPRNDAELYQYFARVHGFWIADRTCCPGHVSPFEFISNVYFQRWVRALAMAAKGTGKTRLLSLLHVANSRFKPGCWTAHMGATQAQANRCYDYVLEEVLRPEITEELDGNPLRSITKWKPKDEVAQGSRIEILTGTVQQACLPGSQGVITDRGTLRIRDIVRKKLAVNVLSYSFERSAWEWQPITGWHDNGEHQDFLGLVLRDHRTTWRDLCATANHQIVRPDGSKTVLGDLKPGDRVCVRGFVPSAAQRELVLGLLLGDGHIDKYGRLIVVHGRNQDNYLDWCAGQLEGFSPSMEECRGGFGTMCRRLRTKAHPWLRELRRTWYMAGKKKIPDAALDNLGGLGLAVWLMDDGTVSMGDWKIATHCWDSEDREKIQQWFTDRDLYGKFMSAGRSEQYSWRFSSSSSRLVDTIVLDCIDVSTPLLVGRKRWRGAPIPAGVDGLVDVEIASVEPVRLRGKSETNRSRTTAYHYPQHRYDLTVFENHNYCTGSGILIGNSGPHEQIGTVDEFDQLDWDVWQHFNKTMHESNGIKAQVVLASTRFNMHGPVNRVIKELGSNLQVAAWCVWDTMATCRYDCKSLPAETGIHAGKQCPLYERTVREADGSEHTEPMCGGKAHHANGHLSWDEVVNSLLLSDAESFGILQELKEPGKQGMFLPECDQLKHLRDEYVYVEGRPVYLGYDDGYANPLCLGAWQVRPEDGLVYQFDEVYATKKLAREVCSDIATRPWLKDVEIGWPDPNGKQSIEEFRRFFMAVLGRPVMRWNTDNSRIDGWRVLRRRLRGPLGGTTIGWNRTKCPKTWADIVGLQRLEGTEDCEKKLDHGADQSRYLIRNLEQHLGIKLQWEEDRRPDGLIDVAAKAVEAQAEGMIQERWDQLRAAGIREEQLKEVEGRYAGERAAFAQALGGWLAEFTIQGRMRRAGMTTDDDEHRPD